MNEPKPVIPPEVDWPVRAIGELVSLLRRGTSPVYADESDVMAIGQRCITDTEFDRSRARPHSSTAMSKVLTPESDDVLINSTGTGTIGRSVVFRDDGNKYIVDGHVTVARPRKAGLVGRWLNDLLRSPEGQRYLEARCYAGSTNQIELSSSALASAPIAIPPVIEQRRIAEVLDTLDEQIRITEQIVVKLKLAKRGLLRDLLSRGVDRNGQLRDPLRHPEQFEATSLGVLPKGWTISSIEAACSLVVDCPHSTPEFLDSGVFVARTTNIRHGAFLASSASYVSEAEYRKRISRAEPSAGDVILTREAPVGEAFVIPRGMRICLGQRVMLLRPREGNLDPQYLLAQLYSGRVRERIDLLTAGTTNPHINVAEVKRFELPIPSIDEQIRISLALEAHDNRAHAESRRLEKLGNLKSGLMSDLMTGRVRVALESVS